MSRANPMIYSFNAGEISPALWGRVDLAKYYNACEILENMITRPHGPAFKRPGTYFAREVIGRDHVTNGTFATDTIWTKGTGWTITGGKAVGAAGSESDIYQDPGDLVEGQVYEVIFTISDRTAGTVTPKVGGTAGTARITDATYTERITCGGDTIAVIAKSANFDGKIDNVSVRKIAPKTRLESFQFSTVQAYILEFTDKNLRFYKDNGIIVAGKEYVTNGTFDTDTDWTKGVGWTIAGGKAVGVAGILSHIHQSSGDLIENQAYEITFTLSDITAGSVQPGVGGLSGTARYTNGTYTEEIICGPTEFIYLRKSTGFDGKIDDVSVKKVIPESDRTPYELITPYLEDDLFTLKMTQSADTMYIVHPSYAPRKLTRTGHTSWALTEIDFTNGPWDDENTTDRTLTPSYAAWVSGGPYAIDDCCSYGGAHYRNKTGTNTAVAPDIDSTNWEIITTNFCGSNLIVTASEGLFETDHVGAKWRITHNREDTSLKGSFNSVTNSDTIKCKGEWEFITHGTWTGTMIVERSADDGDSWQLYRRYTSANDSNVRVIGEEFEDDVIFRVGMSERTSGTCNFDFLVYQYLNYGIVEIDTRNSATEVVCTVIKTINKLEATKLWNESAWNDYRGYPGCVDFFEERLIFVGSTAHPQTTWASKIGDYENMTAGSYEDDAFIYTIAARGVNPIRWIVSQNAILMGTKGAEWKMGTPNMEAPLSVMNMSVKRQSAWGSADIQALLVNDVVLFVQRASTKIRELTEDPGSLSGKYIAPDLTMLAEHITEGGIVDLAYQQEPTAIVWCIRNDGVLLGLTYERTQEVVGWHRHFTYEGDDGYESVAINVTTGEDEVWVCVQRQIGGEIRKYIEYFKPWDWGSDRKDCFFVDSGLTSDAGAAMDITGASKTNPVVIDNIAHGFSDGDEVKILSVVGMTELNENIYTVANKNADDFELTDSDGNDIDGTGFTTYTSGGTAQKVSKSYSGLSHLAGRTVSILADGCTRPDVVVASDGTITLADYANKIHVGLGYTSKLKPMDIEAGAQAGVAQGKKKRIHKVTVRLQDTMACKMGTSEDDLEEINFRGDEDPADAPVPLFTGDKDLHAFPGGHETSGDVLITNDVPLPLTVVAIMPEMKTEDLL